MTVLELLTAVALPADTDVSELDTVLVDTLRSMVGYASAGRTPEPQALAVLDERLTLPDTEGYLFAADSEDLMLVIPDGEALAMDPMRRRVPVVTASPQPLPLLTRPCPRMRRG